MSNINELQTAITKIGQEKSPYWQKKVEPWLVCLAASLFFFYDFVQTNMFNAISLGVTKSFSLDATHLGNLSAAYLYSSIIVLFPIGLLLDRYSTRRLILIAMSVNVISTGLFAISTSLIMAHFFRLIGGIGGAFCFLCTVMLTTRWFPPQRLAFVTGLIITIGITGGIFAQTPLTLLVDYFGWRLALLCTTLGGLLILLLIHQNVRDYPKNNNSSSQSTTHKKRIGFWLSIRLALTNLQNWFCGWYTCLLNLPILMLGALWGNAFLTEVHQLSRTQASFVITMIYVGTILGSPVFGWFSDTICSRRLPMIVGAVTSLVAILTIIYLPHPSFPTLTILFFILGFCTSAQIISYPAVAESNPKSITGAAEGFTAVIIMSGGAIFQPLFGWLMDLHNHKIGANKVPTYTAADYKYAFMILPIAFAISLLLALATKETYNRH